MIRNGAIYLGASVINKAGPFLLLPLMTSYLTPAEFGKLSLFLMVSNLFFAVIGMGIHTNISKNFFAIPRAELKELIGNVFIVLTGASILLLLFCLAIALSADHIFSMPAVLWIAFPFLSFMLMVNTINLTILRNEGRAYVYAVFEICNTLFVLGITVILVVGYDFGWYGQVVGMVVANLLFCILSFIYIRRRNYLNLSPKLVYIKSILKLSLPLIPHTLGAVVIAVSDRIFIERMVGLEAVALYSIGYSFGMILGLVTDAFIKAWSPWFFKVIQYPTDKIKRDIVRYTYAYIFVSFCLAGIISFLATTFLPLVVQESYLGASEYIIFISIGCAVQGIYKIFFPYLVHISKTSFLAFSTLIAALTNLIFNYYFIINYGAIGAAYSTVLSYALSAFLVFNYQRLHFSMPWAIWKI